MTLLTVLPSLLRTDNLKGLGATRTMDVVAIGAIAPASAVLTGGSKEACRHQSDTGTGRQIVNPLGLAGASRPLN